MSSPPTRLPDDLYEAARRAAAVASRSTAQQIAHWARVGRELEASPDVSIREVQRVLAGLGPYASLNEGGQAVVRAEWDERIADGIGELNFAAEFTAAGDTWIVGDGKGGAVVRTAAKK
ncbi:TA system antitoxin ParD family protein [Nakamurella multipartita]|uniref:ParD-like antitoxin of type II toxin-antitoxin system n=1 Tax=Nakamurella multipartita (strain ATCC 700099 / DSM 44233 / CIP 104796 / JCM 9543 / NBRC 105858 / Y-104) TaxID=479431 RepID=C8X6P5_NAKMY|nr:hypothetical protein [Nakamurella multipartita]ACV80793.1 hypothetical protein Namu_4514 [Nakamurella multipartita DSM 44233]